MQTNVRILPMTLDETTNQFASLVIDYHFAQSPFGRILMAFTHKGLCSITLAKDEKNALEHLKASFPKATFKERKGDDPLRAISIFEPNSSKAEKPVCVHLKGTPFQLQVWQALLEIPFGKTATYGEIAGKTGRPKACRAVGSAVGENPLFFLIPCHRVVLSTGAIGQYHWGTALKAAMLEWESVRSEKIKG
jgi:AraC family transcriptional regulator of adaptative response/methylated-DNA-[protein]-cysteine methyltransferase